MFKIRVGILGKYEKIRFVATFHEEESKTVDRSNLWLGNPALCLFAQLMEDDNVADPGRGNRISISAEMYTLYTITGS
jgi:hypothetical protein